MGSKNFQNNFTQAYVIVQKTSDGQVEVSAIDPVISMQAIENPTLKEVAAEIRNNLKKVKGQISKKS